MKTSPLKNLEFELAYLSLLTKEGLKPLSRWEKAFDSTTEESLRRLGLKTRVVERSVQSGRRLRELLFSSPSNVRRPTQSALIIRLFNPRRPTCDWEGLL